MLVNGANGIGTGWSTNLPNFNPWDVIDVCLKHVVKRRAIEDGTVEIVEEKEKLQEEQTEGGAACIVAASSENAGAVGTDAMEVDKVDETATTGSAPGFECDDMKPYYDGHIGEVLKDEDDNFISKAYIFSGPCKKTL